MGKTPRGYTRNDRGGLVAPAPGGVAGVGVREAMTCCASCGHGRGFHGDGGCARCISRVVAFSQGRYEGKAPAVCREYVER